MNVLNFLWKNATCDYRGCYDDWGLTFYGWILTLAIVFFVIRKIWIVCDEILKESKKKEDTKLKKLGYSDRDDIDVFLDRIGASFEDFIKSKGLRKQYDIFSEGKTSDFLKKAEAVKSANDSTSDGVATGFVAGVCAGNMINQSHT